MAKFSNNPAGEVDSRQGRAAGQPSLVARTAFEKFNNLENAAAPPRPSNIHKSPSFKPPLGTKPSVPDTSDKDPKPPHLKSNAVASKVAALAQAANRETNEKPGFPRPLGPKPTDGLKAESKPLFPKPPDNRLPGSTAPKNELRPPGLPRSNFKPEPQGNETKPVSQMAAGFKEKIIAASQENDPKPPFLKPALGKKPGLHPVPNEEAPKKYPSLNPTSPSPLGLKPKPNSFLMAKDVEGKRDNGVDSTASPFPGVALRHVADKSSLSPALPKSYGQPSNEEARPSVAKNIFKVSQEDSGSTSGAPKFTGLPRATTTGPWDNNSEKEEKDKNLPRRKAIPPPVKLGLAPQKPSRPPTVNLEKFRKYTEESELFIPYLLLVLYPTQQQPFSTWLLIWPSFKRSERGERDVCPLLFLELSINHFLFHRPTSRDEERKKEKEERKKSEKEQKEKEKKEQDIRKKFKLVGPIEVIHQARACTDFKGGKNDLTFKQGDKIEIIRITDNPEGKWLGRSRGSYGYIKTTMVEIDYDSLKRKPRPSVNIQLRQPDSDQEVYDDVGEQDSVSRYVKRDGFPPPPPSDDIYDGIEGDDDAQTRSAPHGEDKSDSWPRGLLKNLLKGKDFPKRSIREAATKINVTEDNGGSSIVKSLSIARAKSDDRDSQKLKKMEKEEKEFRKKFKYEGDIRVLYTTTISRAPSAKKRGSKDLQVKPGDSVEVIKNVDDTKVLCRNEEGKCKYQNIRTTCFVVHR
uniref:FYN binding protein 1 n=1 Tax=Podarcis muralis TaxID=64176 RepID=A0A670JRJ0_PODMU